MTWFQAAARENKEQITVRDKLWVRIDHLKQMTNYVFLVQAKTKIGRGGASAKIFKTHYCKFLLIWPWVEGLELASEYKSIILFLISYQGFSSGRFCVEKKIESRWTSGLKLYYLKWKERFRITILRSFCCVVKWFFLNPTKKYFPFVTTSTQTTSVRMR